MFMSRTAGKFIAVILAIWLPLFSGNALAASVAMRAMAGGHHSAVAQLGEPMPHCASTAQQHAQQAQFEADPGQSGDRQNQQNSVGDNCGTCHFACCGYLAAAPVEVTKAQPSARLFASLSTQFQSTTPAPLDPPPLARA
ncbi:MAG: hypothetical protein A2Z65_11765 [Gallionellales bacterium RIFCSPLOWO2_02_58_13]|nr:MAG: hypothetical protein A2Z65_11765 [Gallionellales bacterium RIFCSPLOWO2_02_58_13]